MLSDAVRRCQTLSAPHTYTENALRVLCTAQAWHGPSTEHHLNKSLLALKWLYCPVAWRTASPREPPVDNSRGLIQRILTHAASGALTGAEWPRAHVAPGPRFARLSRSFWSELGLSRPLMRVANDRSFEIEMQWQAARYASLNRACGEVSGDPSSDADAPLAVGFGGRNSEEVENLGQWLQSGTICRL